MPNLINGAETGEYVASLDSKFKRPASTDFDKKENIKFIFLLALESDVSTYTSIIELYKTLKEEDATWAYVTTLFLREQKRFLITMKYTRIPSTDD